MIEIDTRLRAARGFGKTETEASLQALSTLKQRGHPDAPPPLASDGWGGHREALVEIWGQVPEYGGRGRPPTRKKPKEEWQYLQVVKQRSHGQVTGVQVEVLYGKESSVRETLGKSIAYVERTHLTMRHMNGRLIRKTLGFSKELRMLKASCVWEDTVYNLARPVKTLRVEVSEANRRWEPRSPAMVAGLVDHIWTLEELLTTLPVVQRSNNI